MTLTEETNPKHPKMSRPDTGNFSRNELAITGASCSVIRELAYALIRRLSPALKITYVDADHPSGKNDGEANASSALLPGASMEYTNKISFHQLNTNLPLTALQQKMICNEQALVLLNGNHYTAQNQVVIIDPAKPLGKTLDRLTNVRMVILRQAEAAVPERLLPYLSGAPVILMDDIHLIAEWVTGYLDQRKPVLNGLVLAGGLSTRMHTDKGSLEYHGKSQRRYVYDLLVPYCNTVAVSCNRHQSPGIIEEGLPVVEDRFTGLGPLNGILSAFQLEPDAAWLVVACDLPLLSARTLQHLTASRNPYKTATAFTDPEGKFPEPLITIWEPRSYPVLLQWMSLGYNCPRKMLINADIMLLQAPDVNELHNANDPAGYAKAMHDLKKA